MRRSSDTPAHSFILCIDNDLKAFPIVPSGAGKNVKLKENKKGELKRYEYWHASWREGPKVRNVYLGSCSKMTEEEALHKARSLKADALGV